MNEVAWLPGKFEPNQYKEWAVVEQEAGSELLKRLAAMPIQPEHISELVLSPLRLTADLQRLFPVAQLHVVELQNQDWGEIPERSQDVIVANMVLHWYPDISAKLAEIKRFLKPKGVVIFSLLGLDTLRELQVCWQSVVEEKISNNLIDMHHIGDYLVNQGFLHPVMEMDYLTVSYQSFTQYWQENCQLGMIPLVLPSLLNEPQDVPARLRDAYAKQYSGKVLATYEMIYGHAWQPEIAESKQEIRIPIQQLKKKR